MSTRNSIVFYTTLCFVVALLWLLQQPPMTAEQVGEVCVTMADFDVSVVNVVVGSRAVSIFFFYYFFTHNVVQCVLHVAGPSGGAAIVQT